jgi:hypothetical protein
VALVLVAGSAHAFDDPAQFFAPKTFPHAATLSASAEGVYFTGASRFSSQTCQSCHIDAPGQVRLKLGADPPELFTDGYQPGMTYLIEVDLLDEGAGLQYATPTCTEPPGKTDHYNYVQCNNNNFALEVDLGDQPMTSGFCAVAPSGGRCPAPSPSSDETVVGPDGDVVFANRPHDPASPKTVLRNGATTWHLWWTAPPAGSGPATFYVAVVDGDGAAGTAGDDQDPINDDTVQASVPVQEAGGAPPANASAGCSLGARGLPPAAGGVVVALVAALWLRRRARLR